MEGKLVLVCVEYFRNWDLKANLPFGNFTSVFFIINGIYAKNWFNVATQVILGCSCEAEDLALD